MQVTVTLSPGDRHVTEPEVMLSAGQESPASDLCHETLLAVGVRVSIDLTAAHRWRTITVSSWNTASMSIVRAMLGSRAADQINLLLHGWGNRTAEIDVATVHLDTTAATPDPWLRIAAVDALDRWLHLPLDQSLVDAERGAARAAAARCVPVGPARSELLGKALLLCRRSAPGLAEYLARISLLQYQIPITLRDCLRGLADGYRWLRSEVHGDDEALRAVTDLWISFSTGCFHGLRAAPTRSGYLIRTPPSRPSAAGLIDPRQVPARTLLLDPDPDRAEITIRSADPDATRHVRVIIVDVPAFPDLPDHHGPAVRMLARLVDRESGQPQAEALLNLCPQDPGGNRIPLLRGVLRISSERDGIDLENVRVAVFDALSPPQAVTSDHDPALQNARREILAFREWRHLVAEVRLRAGPIHPVSRVHRIERILLPPDETGARVRTPTATQLDRWRCEHLCGLGDSALTILLSGGADPLPTERLGGGILAPVRDSADLLVAEMAAVLDAIPD